MIEPRGIAVNAAPPNTRCSRVVGGTFGWPVPEGKKKVKKVDERVFACVELECSRIEMIRMFQQCFDNSCFIPAISQIDLINATEPNSGAAIRILTVPSFDHLDGRLSEWDPDLGVFSFSVDWRGEKRSYDFRLKGENLLEVTLVLEEVSVFEDFREYLET